MQGYGTQMYGEFPYGYSTGVKFKPFEMGDGVLLHKRNGEVVAQLTHCEDVTETNTLTGVDELSFLVPHTIKDKTGKDVVNPVYHLIDGNMLITYDSRRYLTLTPSEVMEEENSYKEVVAYELQYELRSRIINNFIGEDRVIYDPSNSKDKNGIHYGLLNYVEEYTDWRVGYYNTQALHRKLTLEYNKTNMLQAIMDCQESYQVILNFNTIDKEIEILTPDQIGEDRNLYLSNKNFIKELKKQVNEEDIVTRLYCYGRDDQDISRVNITGQPYIENYSYYMNTDCMSEELIKELKQNNIEVASYHDEYMKLFEELLATEKKESGQLNGIRLQQGQLDKLQDDFDNNIEKEKERERIRKLIEEKESVINDMNKKLAEVQDKISNITNQLQQIAKKVNIENNLSESSQKELQGFIKEGIYNNTNHGKYDLTQLYEEGLEMLNRKCKPIYRFELSLEEFNRYSTVDIEHKLRLGDIVHIENTIADEYFKVKLIGITHTENDIDLKFSSIDSIYDDEIFLDDILADAKKTSEIVDFSKFNWDKAREVDNNFRDYIQSELALANQGIVKAEGQKPILDDRGLWLYKEDKYGEPMPEQIRAVNNIIAITKDNWKNVEVAITPKGVMANQLIGDIILGTDLRVISNSGVVEILENLMTIRDDDGIPRVQLGQYERDKYGLKMTDKSGRNTVLDEGGILQAWQEGRADNVDAKNGLKLHVYIPENTREIYNVKLRYNLEKFRSYSDTTDTEDQTTETTSWEGGTYTSTGWDGSVYTTTGGGGAVIDTTGGGGGLNTTTYGGKDYDIDWFETWLEPYAGAERGGQWFRMVTGHNHEIITDDHYHSITLDEHQHSISIGGHDHSVSIGGHDHSLKIPAHSHDILPIIKVHDKKPNNIKIKINGSYRTFAISGSTSISGNQDNLDITKYLEIGKWNEIELISDGLGRIDATVFIQALINFNYD